MVLLRVFPAAALLGLSSLGGVCHGQTVVTDCKGLQAAFALTKTQNVEIAMDYSQDITCDTLTTMTMNSNTLTVTRTEEQCEFCFASVTLTNVRFEITGKAKLFWKTNALFVGDRFRNVNGGAVFVGKGASARFFDDLGTQDVGVASVADMGDFSSYELSGGCLYVDGYLRVDGDATFERCENGGGGESPPGPGGVMYVGKTGSVLFAGPVLMKEVSIIDDEGNAGGGIYNMGKVNIKGDATFDDLRAEQGGAIFNGAGADFKFKRGASVVFNNCLSFDGDGGAVFNEGSFRLSGPALMLKCRAPAFVVETAAYTKLSADSVFWGFGDEEINPAIVVRGAGKLVGAESVSFINGAGTGCATVEYDGGECL